MKTKLFAALVMIGALTACDDANAQCANCQPQQPTAAANDLPSYVWVRQRRGVFGWRCRWVLMPVDRIQPVNVIGVVR